MAFKVFDLQCDQGHVFEGWFGSHADYDSQRERALVRCPLCDSTSIEKKLSAPRFNASGLKEAAPPSPQASSGHMADAGSGDDGGSAVADRQSRFIQELRQALRKTENVGERFASEARRIHHGDAPERAIRGVATRQEREALLDEGIAVSPIPTVLDDERFQ